MKAPTKEQIKKANAFARKNGHSKATKVIIDNSPSTKAPFISKSTQFGYRKFTTGEYVSNSYRNNFGWKNTYYQHAECEVVIPANY